MVSGCRPPIRLEEAVVEDVKRDDTERDPDKRRLIAQHRRAARRKTGDAFVRRRPCDRRTAHRPAPPRAVLVTVIGAGAAGPMPVGPTIATGVAAARTANRMLMNLVDTTAPFQFGWRLRGSLVRGDQRGKTGFAVF